MAITMMPEKTWKIYKVLGGEKMFRFNVADRTTLHVQGYFTSTMASPGDIATLVHEVYCCLVTKTE